MLFAHDGNIEAAFKKSIFQSLEERAAKLCET